MKRNSLEENYFISSKKVNLVENSVFVNGISLNTLNCNKKSTTDLTQLAEEIDKADTFVQATTCSKLQIIVEQIRFLQQQAQAILSEARIISNLHHVACNFVKIPGNIYHLYRRPTGQQYFSMLSPKEWDNHPHEFIATYRLEKDRSWTPIEDVDRTDSEVILLNKILSAQISTGKSIQDVPMDT